jgi:hypothetical protein
MKAPSHQQFAPSPSSRRRDASRRLQLDHAGWLVAIPKTAIADAPLKALIAYITDERNSQMPSWFASSLAGLRIGRNGK